MDYFDNKKLRVDILELSIQKLNFHGMRQYRRDPKII
jgi:hypothetical protein